MAKQQPTGDRAPKPEKRARYRKIEVRMWSDEKFRTLSPLPPCGQGLWLFLLTGPQTGPIPGLFRAGRAALADELNWTTEAFDEAFEEAFRLGLVKADWKAKVVWIPNAIRCNRPESPNVIKSWRDEWDLVPECDLKREAYETLKSNLGAASEAYAKAFVESCRKPSPKPSVKPSPKPSQFSSDNQEQEQEQEIKEKPLSGKPDDPGLFADEGEQAEEGAGTSVGDGDGGEPAAIIAYLNDRSGHAFRAVESNLRLIRARLAEGATPDECRAVIDAKVLQWVNDPKMAEYLRPATLFNATNYANYAGQLPTPAASSAAEWWANAGFGKRWEAENAGCTEGNAHLWRQCRPIRPIQGVYVEPWSEGEPA